MIFNYKGKNVLKKSVLLYKQGGDGTSHLYTLIVQPDNTVRVEVDQEKLYEGTIIEDWEVLKAKTTNDPDDKKDTSMMDDPEDKKLDDCTDEKVSLMRGMEEGEFSEAREDLAMRMPISGIYKIKVSVMSLQVSSNMVS